jgi:SAM-dependent methyltransferase
MIDEQIAFWNGPAAVRWSEHQVALDRALSAFGRAALERADARMGEHVLDVGCGCGDSALALAGSVGTNGSVIGVDVSTTMLARARARGAALSNLQFIEADAATFKPSAARDLIFSRFGIMFFADPARAFTHLRTVLRTDGRIVFVCWRAFAENPWAQIPVEVLQRVDSRLTPPAFDSGPGPYAFADENKVQRLLADASFDRVQVDRFDADVLLSSSSVNESEAVEFAIQAGPASRMLIDASPDLRARASQEMARVLATHRTPAGYTLPGSSWVVSAHAR